MLQSCYPRPYMPAKPGSKQQESLENLMSSTSDACGGSWVLYTVIPSPKKRSSTEQAREDCRASLQSGRCHWSDMFCGSQTTVAQDRNNMIIPGRKRTRRRPKKTCTAHSERISNTSTSNGKTLKRPQMAGNRGENLLLNALHSATRSKTKNQKNIYSFP